MPVSFIHKTWGMCFISHAFEQKMFFPCLQKKKKCRQFKLQWYPIPLIFTELKVKSNILKAIIPEKKKAYVNSDTAYLWKLQRNACPLLRNFVQY